MIAALDDKLNNTDILSSENDMLSSPPIMVTSPTDYDASMARYEKLAKRYEKLANLKLRNFDTIVLGGYGCCIKVRNGGLSIEYTKADTTEKLLKLHRGIHKIKQIILCSHGGYISLDAIEWCCQQNITVIMLNFKGELLHVLTPKQTRNAKLTYLQVLSTECVTSALSIATELIRRKTLSQISVLEKRYGSEQIVATLENGLTKLHNVTSIEELRFLEAKLAASYWSCFYDIPIKWHQSAYKVIPDHWKKIAPRSSPLSYSGSGRYAVNPFHAALNFAYALLQADVLQAINVIGLEPTIGYLHSYDSSGLKLSLVYDLMEPFRAHVDRMVFNFFRETTFKKGDFIQTLSGEARLNEGLRDYILASCRVDYIQIDRLCRWLRSTIMENS